MVLLGVFLFVLGVGIGMTMQNLVLAVQNTVAASDLGPPARRSPSSAASAARSASPCSAPCSAAGSPLIRQGLPPEVAGKAAPAASGSPTSRTPAGDPDLIRVSYGDATGRIFLISAVMAVVAWSPSCSSARSRCGPRAASSGRRDESATLEPAV